MIPAFIDFVKPFSMLLPMCLQGSKSDLIQRNGASMSREKSLDGKGVKAEDRSILKLNYPLSWPDYKILPTCPSEFWLGNLEALGIHYDLTMNNRCTVY